MTAEVAHTDVAAYALDLLDENDRRAFEAHFACCGPCAEELADFAGLAEILRDVPPVGPVAEDDVDRGQVIDLPHRRRRGTALLGAAAGVLLLAGGALTGAFVAGHSQGAMGGHSGSFDEVFAAGEKVSASSATTGVAGLVAMRPMGWGTEVGMRLSHLKGPLVCALIAVSRDGVRHTVMEWRVPAQGYGVPGSPESLRVHGGTSVDRADLARFDVRVEGSDRILLRIRV
ncbi:MAG: anti-sigma factor family protein [Actinoallomurus sp.]